MDFKTAIEHYQKGSATEAERLLVEDAVDKFLLLEALVREDAPAEEPAQMQQRDLFQNVRRNLRKRSAVQIVVSVLLSLSLLLGILKIAIPAAESLFWQPKDSSFGVESSDLLMVLDTYANLFCPEIDIRSAKETHTGFASYTLELEYFTAENYPRCSYSYAALEKGTLSVPESFWPMVTGNRLSSEPLNRFQRELYIERLSQLPEYIAVSAFVSFAEDVSMHELLSFRWELVKDNPNNLLTQTGYYWTAIRCYGDTDENYSLPRCGLGAGGYVPASEMNRIYPNFDGTQYPGDMSQGISVDSPALARIYENQFISHLTFMRDMSKKNRGIGEPDFYEKALDYIAANGIQVYGCFIVTTPEKLLQIMEMDNVSGIYLQDFWMGP